MTSTAETVPTELPEETLTGLAGVTCPSLDLSRWRGGNYSRVRDGIGRYKLDGLRVEEGDSLKKIRVCLLKREGGWARRIIQHSPFVSAP